MELRPRGNFGWLWAGISANVNFNLAARIKTMKNKGGYDPIENLDKGSFRINHEHLARVLEAKQNKFNNHGDIETSVKQQ